MSRILVLMLILMLLPGALAAEQSFLVTDPDAANGSEWLKEAPAEYLPVLERIAAQDAEAAKAASVYFYPDGDGCWVFCRTKADVYHSGTFWYVTDDAAHPLGGGANVWDWDFFPGERVFYCATGEKENRTVNAAIAVNGAPALLNVPPGIVSLHGMAGGQILCGVPDSRDLDYCFLTVDGGELCELEATPMTPAEFTALPGAQEVLIELTEANPSLTTASFLVRDNGVITLNAALDDGSMQHAYFWIEENGLSTLRDWEGEIVLHDGEGRAKLNVGARIIKTTE